MKGSHAQAELKKLYAAEKGIPLRTAQYHAKHGHPDYLAFVARTGAAAVARPKTATPAQQIALTAHLRAADIEAPPAFKIECDVSPPAMSIPPSQRTPEQYAECEAWDALCIANAQRRLALESGDGLNCVAFCNIAANALKAYHLARSKRVAADIEAGRLKPAQAWTVARGCIQQIAALLHSMEGSLAPLANPSDPLQAQRGIAAWKLQKWNPAVQQVMLELGGALAA